MMSASFPTRLADGRVGEFTSIPIRLASRQRSVVALLGVHFACPVSSTPSCWCGRSVNHPHAMVAARLPMVSNRRRWVR